MGGFFGQLAAAAGQNLIQGQQFDMRQAELEQQQQQVAAGKMKAEQAAQSQKTQQEVSAYLKGNILNDQGSINDPMQISKAYDKAALMELSAGNFLQAEQLSNLSKGKRKEAEDAQETVNTKNSMAKDALAKAAMDYTENPSNEGANDIAHAAVLAGQDPSSIPLPNGPAWLTFVAKSKFAASTSKQQLEFNEKVSEVKDKNDERKREFDRVEQDKTEQRRDAAAVQAGIREDRSETRKEAAAERTARRQERELDYRRDRADRAFDTKEKREYDSTKMTADQKKTIDAVVSSGNEAISGFKAILELPAGQTTGPFTGLHDGTVLSSLEKSLGNTITSRDANLYNTATSGLALEVGRVLTLGGGKGVNKAQLDEFKEMLTARPGDDKYVAMYKLANGVRIVREKMRSTRDSDSPKILAVQRETEDFLKNFPSQSAVIAASIKAGKPIGENAISPTMRDAMDKVSAAYTKEETPKETAPAETPGYDEARNKYKKN